MFEDGRDLKQDFAEAVRLYIHIAAGLGDAAAQYNFGLIFLHGRGVAKSKGSK